ncbi:MAG: NAD-dependent succinate-semialdehyde dehydrogenase [Deltaproteobacteria bacterium]|nr:NAD-dependent succinate-semialdehyde dehydrogenase [Deltaproteobacteria bacterium]
MVYRTLNPATEELIKTYPEIGWDEVKRRAEKSQEAFRQWRKSSLPHRRELFIKLAKRLREEKSRHATIMTMEMGKPIVEAETEIEKCALGCEFYAENSENFLKEERLQSDASKSYVRFDPLGTILIIMPWNFPYWQAFRCSIPAIMAGNAVLLKHAPNVPDTALHIESLYREAGFPEGLFQNLFCSNEVAAQLIESPYIEGVSLTGSTRAGSQVASVAGKSIKKTVLELGGSDPFIVFPDADLEKCIPMALRSRFLNAGQSCIAAKRFIITQEIAPAFEEKFLQAIVAQKVGNPMERETKIGPMAREDLVENLSRQVEESKKKGAVCLTGGTRRPGKGYFYQPTFLKEVQPGMVVCEEETFGPVASMIVVKNEEEAIDLANRTPYGLGASLWTRNTHRAEEIAKGIDAGNVFINGMTKSDPRLPFGGSKRSGYGRELSVFGIREFTNIKTVWIA